MIVHVFNTSVLSGPERLVLPALASRRDRFLIVNLREERIAALRGADPLEAFSRSLGIPFAGVPVRRRWDQRAITELRNLLDRTKPELVHAHISKASIYVARCGWRSRPSFPIVSTHHGVHGLPDMKSRVYETAYRRLFLRSFDRVLCVSKDDYETIAASGISGKKLRLHFNGVDGHPVDPSRRVEEKHRIRDAWSLDGPAKDAFLMGAVGRLSAEKDHARLLNALWELEKLGCSRDWRCLVFGVGDLLESLQGQVRQLGLEHRVIWMGYRTEMSREMAGLDLLVSFSKAEGLPINVIEAGWAATPVLCTRVGGIKDLVPDERFGTTVSDAESPETTARELKSLIENGKDVQETKGARLQSRVADEFSRDRWLTRLREIYLELGVSV